MIIKNRNQFYPYLFILPAFVIFTVFFVYPCASSFYLSFTDWDGVAQVKNFIGFRNFISAFTNKDIFSVFPNTFYYAILNTLLINFFSFFLALALNRSSALTNILRVVYYVPIILSGIVVGFVFQQIFAPVFKVETMQMGALNGLLHLLGLDSLMHNWLGEKATAMNCVLLVSLWQYLGFHALIYFANMQSIPKDLYEAADIDGVKTFQKLRYITWPMLAPALTINLTLLTIGSLKVFDLMYSLTKGGPGGTTKVIGLAIYEQAFYLRKVGYGSALSVILAVIVFIITILLNIYLRKREVDS